MQTYPVKDTVAHSRAMRRAEEYAENTATLLAHAPFERLGAAASNRALVSAIDSMHQFRIVAPTPNVFTSWEEGAENMMVQFALADRISEATIETTKHLRGDGLQLVDIIVNRATAEALFWRKRIHKTDWLAWHDLQHSTVQRNEINRWSRFLGVVMRNPAFLPYINVGITDVAAIRRFAAGDVDADIAKSLIG